MTFRSNLFAQLNNCSLLRSFCQGFTSTMWFNMNAFNPIMNSASLFSLGWMNWASPPTTNMGTLPSLYTDSLTNCYQGSMYTLNNSTSLFTNDNTSFFANNNASLFMNNNVNYVNNSWSCGSLQSNTWNIMPQFTFNNSRRTSNPTSRSNTNQGPGERSPITVEGIDYSIMGSDAAKVKLLRPEMQRKVEQMFKYAKSKGWTLSITSAYRSTALQKDLYDRWKAGTYDVPVVAEPGTSRHEFGCAVDISVSGNGASAKEMGRYGRSIGLRWGGDWSSNEEDWHFDLDPSKTPTS